MVHFGPGPFFENRQKMSTYIRFIRFIIKVNQKQADVSRDDYKDILFNSTFMNFIKYKTKNFSLRDK